MSKPNRASVQEMTQDLRELVAELMKTQPDRKSVQTLSQKAGVHYSDDLIELMSVVLKKMNAICSDAQLQKRKTQETSI